MCNRNGSLNAQVKKMAGFYFLIFHIIHPKYQSNAIYSTSSTYLKSVQFSPSLGDHHLIPGLLP